MNVFHIVGAIFLCSVPFLIYYFLFQYPLRKYSKQQVEKILDNNKVIEQKAKYDQDLAEFKSSMSYSLEPPASNIEPAKLVFPREEPTE